MEIKLLPNSEILGDINLPTKKETVKKSFKSENAKS